MRYRLILPAVLAAIAAFGLAVPAAAAPPLSADARAVLLKPLTLTRILDLNFGTVIPNGIGGFVTINADTGARTASDNSLRLMSDEGNRAYFGGGGTPNQLVVLSTSPPGNLVNLATGDTIPLLSLTIDQLGNPVRTIDPTTKVFYVGVGGTIFIRADQGEGVYTTTFDLIANYF